MAKKFTRRQILTTSAATTGAFFTGIERKPAHAWSPGPDENLVRDLTTGLTPVRLGTGMGRRKDENLEEMVKRIKESGYTGVVTGPDPWHSMKDAELTELKNALKKYDVVVYEVGGYRNLLHVDESERQKNLAHIARCIEAAEKIGCPMVGTISGSRCPKTKRQDNFNVHPDNWTQKTWYILVKGIKQILKDTAGMKAAIGMEAQVTTNIDGPRAHKRLIDDVADSRCVVNLDPTNMISLATYYHTTELINECFDLLGEHILGCHAKDTYILPEQQTVHVQEVCPGRGVLDYETFLVRMSRMKWPRTLLPEHIPGDQYIEAKQYIEKVAEKVGVKIHK